MLRTHEEKVARISWKQNVRQDTFVLFSVGGFTDELRAIADARDDVVFVDDSRKRAVFGRTPSGCSSLRFGFL